MAKSDMNVAAYIRERSDELQRLSRDARLHLLEHIFRMAALEAARHEGCVVPLVVPQLDNIPLGDITNDDYLSHCRATLQEPLEDLVNVVANWSKGNARAAFYVADQSGAGLHRIAGMSAAYGAHTAGFKIGTQSIACGLAAATRRPVFTEDVTGDPSWRSWQWLAAAFDYRSCWSFPIEGRGGRLFGTLSMYFRSPSLANERDIQFAATISDTAAEIIGRRGVSFSRAAS